MMKVKTLAILLMLVISGTVYYIINNGLFGVFMLIFILLYAIWFIHRICTHKQKHTSGNPRSGQLRAQWQLKKYFGMRFHP
jgi:Na+-transporting methylmalonyl-CoA/oxaloacetate decarboxylase gamma subunit